MTELEVFTPQNELSVQMDYARTVSSAALLPQAYRGKPADIMLAMGLGQAMGLSPAESLYRIDVIQGKPTASAELIAANVRKAGHRLRVKIDEANVSVTATIIRSDDPEDPNPPTITRDRKWAADMGLSAKDNYKKQPLTMLQWRAITAVARLACPEALYGVAYTADEMYDVPGAVTQAGGGLAAALAGNTPTISAPDESPDAVVAPVETPTPSGVESDQPDTERMLTNTTKFGKAFYARVSEAAFESDQARLEYISETVGRFVESTKELTETEARAVLARLDEEAGIADADVVEGGAL